MTWKDFSIIVMGKEKKELNEWARTRNLAYIIYLSNTAEKSPKSLRAFWHIPSIDDVEVEEEYTESDVCDWIDEVGSIFNSEGQLLEYIKYIVSKTTNNEQIKDSVEKKKPNKANVGRHTS
jgi:hypothetical protein